MSKESGGQPSQKTLRSVLPSPLELAKIAAALRPNTREFPEAITDAIRLYLHAADAVEEYGVFSHAELAVKLKDLALIESVLRRHRLAHMLRLYRDDAQIDADTRNAFFEGGIDPVRRYLMQKAPHLSWKKSRQVRDTIRQFFLDLAARNNERSAAAIKSGREQIWDGDKELSAFLKRSEVRGEGTYKTEAMSDSESWTTQNYHEGPFLYWEFDQDFLDQVVEWRLAVKARGGVRRLREKLKRAPVKPVK